jgi:hypothetical protein
MSSSIGLSSNHVWFVQTWTFRQLIEDVRVQYPRDDIFGTFLDNASILQFIRFSWDETASVEAARRIYLTAKGISEGELESGLEGDESLPEYKESLSQLVSLVEGSGKLAAAPPGKPGTTATGPKGNE